MKNKKGFFIKSLMLLGVLSSSISADVPNAPGMYVGISKLTNTSVNISTKDNSSDENGFYVLVYDYSTSTLFKTISVSSSDNSHLYAQVTGLTCDKTYKTTVIANNSDGNSTESNARYFNLKSTFGANCATIPDEPTPPEEEETIEIEEEVEVESTLAMPGPYIGISAIKGSSTSVRVSFKDNSDNEDGFRVFGDGVDVNVSAHDETKSAYVAVTLTGLTCSKLYQLQAISYKNGVESDMTNKRAFTIRGTLGVPCVEKTSAQLALEKIGLYADDNSNPLPSLQDYIDAGVVGVSADNLIAINTAVGKKYQLELNTLFKLNQLILAVTSNSCLTREELIAKITNYTLIDLTALDTSCITDMSYLFYDMINFNQDISGWDTSSVTNMSHMFDKAVSFNQDISGWDTNKVTNMSYMFAGNTIDAFLGSHIHYYMEFNQPIDSWDVSNVTDMSGMFTSTHNFNQELSSWDVSKVTNMSEMFQGAFSFNKDISSWNTNSVTNMSRMFKSLHIDATYPSLVYEFIDFSTMAFNQPLDGWNVSNVTDMSEMFSGATSFNQSLNNWDVLAVRNIERMFYRAKKFNSSIDLWNVETVTNMKQLFIGAEVFNQDISGWNTQNVINMEGMFMGYDDGDGVSRMSFNQNLNGWDVCNVLHHNNFFEYETRNTEPNWQ